MLLQRTATIAHPVRVERAVPQRESLLGAALADNKGLLYAVAAVVALATAIQAATGLPVLLFIAEPTSYVIFLVGMALALPLRVLHVRLTVRDEAGRWVHDTRDGWRVTWARCRPQFLSAGSMVRALCATFLLGMALAVFGGWKRLIPVVHQFSWDARLETWDRWLLAGQAPWEWLAPYLNAPWSSRLLDGFYFHTLAGCVLVVGWVAWSRSPIRATFLVGLVVMWILLGAVVATMFASAGPAFAATGFGEQGAYLRAISPELLSVTSQRVMWDLYLTQTPHPVGGISAMPSIHVATPTLIALAAGTRYKRLFWPGWLMVLLTVIATVHLGWHYGVDAYVSFAAVCVCWSLATWRLRRTGVWTV